MMEIRLKERLVGATVLVLAAVVFIPILLDGPNGDRQVSRSVPLPEPESERRTVRIDLDAASATQSSSPSTNEKADSTVDEPVAIDLTPQQAAEPAAKPELVPQRKAEQTQASVREAPAVADDAEWTVQAGSFSRADNAEGLAARLRQSGHAAYVSEFRDGGRVHYRVRVGGYPTREAAQAKADEIRASTGEPARPVPVG